MRKRPASWLVMVAFGAVRAICAGSFAARRRGWDEIGLASFRSRPDPAASENAPSIVLALARCRARRVLIFRTLLDDCAPHDADCRPRQGPMVAYCSC